MIAWKKTRKRKSNDVAVLPAKNFIARHDFHQGGKLGLRAQEDIRRDIGDHRTKGPHCLGRVEWFGQNDHAPYAHGGGESGQRNDREARLRDRGLFASGWDLGLGSFLARRSGKGFCRRAVLARTTRRSRGQARRDGTGHRRVLRFDRSHGRVGGATRLL